MTLIDAILVLTCGLAFARWPLSTPLALAAALGLAAVTLALEGWRQPLLPAYVVCLGLLVAALLPVERLPVWLQWLGVGGGVLLLALSVVACNVFPILRYPAAGGSYGVGSTEVPPALIERYSATPRRPLNRAAPVATLWYPTAPVPEQSWIGQQIYPHARNAAVKDAPLSNLPQRLPVIVYFPGWPGTATQNVVLIRELVSQGFLVVSIVYPGKLPSMTEQEFARSSADFKLPYDFSSHAGAQHTIQFFEDRVRHGAEDASMMLQLLQGVDVDGALPAFRGRLALDQAGVFGFSMGGAVAAQAGWLEPRFKAVVNMDGRHWDESLRDGVAQPYLYMTEVLYMPSAADLSSADLNVKYNAEFDKIDYTNVAANLKRHGGLQVTLSGMSHLNFSDMNLRSPLRRYRQGGSIDRFRALEVVNAYVTSFFERELQGKPQPWLDADSSRFPEARVTLWPPSTARVVVATAASENSATLR